MYQNQTFLEEEREPAQMSYFTCNAADHTGYSISWRHKLIGIYMHRKGETMHHLGPDLPNTCWFYIPVEPSERITAIWRRKGIFASLTVRSFYHLRQHYEET